MLCLRVSYRSVVFLSVAGDNNITFVLSVMQTSQSEMCHILCSKNMLFTFKILVRGVYYETGAL